SLCRRSDGNAQSCIAQTSQQVGHGREGTAQGQVMRLEPPAAPLFELLAMVSLLSRRQKDRNELVAAFPDLAPHLLEGDVVAELDHGFMPGKRVEIDRVEQGAVEIKDGGFGHKAFLLFSVLRLPRTRPNRASSLPCGGSDPAHRQSTRLRPARRARALFRRPGG